MESILKRLKQRVIPHPHGFAFSAKASVIFLLILALCVVAALLFGDSVIAVMVFAIGGCGYIIADVLRSAKNAPPEKAGRKIHTVATCCFTGFALIVCLALLVQYLSGAI